MMEDKKVVLITGSSGEFGRLTAKSLAKNGYIVYAFMRDISGRNKSKADELVLWAKENGHEIRAVEMDVTDNDSVQRAVDNIIEDCEKIDVVINNAGIGVLGLQENFTADDWKRLFDVNVFGMQRVNRSVLPHMRKRKEGLIIHVSSLLGRMIVPAYGPYNSSKWAVEALAESYRVELSGFGIQSCVVEPGGFPTTFIDNLMKPSDTSRNEDYGEFSNFPKIFLENFEKALAGNPSQDPQNVADAIVNLIDMPAKERPFRTVVDKMGMGDAIGPYNDKLEEIMHNIYSAFHMSNLLELKDKAEWVLSNLNFLIHSF